jgi:hypothetical protein
MVYSVSISEDGKNFRTVFKAAAASMQIAEEHPPDKSVSVSEDGNNFRTVFKAAAASMQIADEEKKGNMTLYASTDGASFQPTPIYTAATNFHINFPATGGNKEVYASTDGASFQPTPIYNAAAKNFFIKLAPTPPIIQKPADGHVKPGGWGGNQDPSTWHIVSMEDPPTLFKIVDNNNTNIAHRFTTQQEAQQFIDYEKSRSITGGGGGGVRATDGGGGGVGVGVDFNSVIGQGPKLPKENEHHDPKGWREEFGVDQPGPDFQVDYVVEIGKDRENDGEEVSIQYDGLPHSGDNDRTGDKILFKINKGQIQYLHQIDTNNKQMFEVGEKDGVEPGKDKFEPLQKGKMYGLRVIKRNRADGKSTEHWGYMQNLTDGGPLKEVIHVIDHGQFAGDDPRTDWNKNWRVGVRIDGKNGKKDPMYTRGFVIKKI